MAAPARRALLARWWPLLLVGCIGLAYALTAFVILPLAYRANHEAGSALFYLAWLTLGPAILLGVPGLVLAQVVLLVAAWRRRGGAT